MPKGPKGEKRPADVIGAAIMVAKIATGEIEEPASKDDGKDPAAKALGARGGRARAETMSPERWAEIAKAPSFVSLPKVSGSRWLSTKVRTTVSRRRALLSHSNQPPPI